MRWIKASERLPFKEDYYYIKTSEGGMNVRMISQKDTFYREFEWLDETPEEWISVETGNLPAQGERVLVYCDSGLIEKGYRIGGLWERDWAGMTFHEAGYTVTHWMPLPSPPNK